MAHEDSTKLGCEANQVDFGEREHELVHHCVKEQYKLCPSLRSVARNDVQTLSCKAWLRVCVKLDISLYELNNRTRSRI